MRTTTLFRVLLLMGCLAWSCGPPPPSGNRVEATSEDSPWYRLKPREIPLDAERGQPDLTRNFYFIMDGSGSMGDAPDKGCGEEQRFKTKIEGAIWAVEEFLKHVPADVNLGLLVFDRFGTREVVPLSAGNQDVFLRAVNRIKTSGGTPLHEAIVLGAEKLVEQYKRQLGYGEYRLVVVTDGRAKAIPEAALIAAQYGIPIYAIGLCVGEEHPLRKYSVSYRAADNFADLAMGLQETLAELPAFDAKDFN